MNFDAMEIDADNGQLLRRLDNFSFGSTEPAERTIQPDLVKRASKIQERDALAGLTEDDDVVNATSKFEFVRNPQDQNRRRPGDPDFDHTRIYIEPAVWNKLSEPQKLYWGIKKDNYNKIIFYQQGDFFNLFGPDAQVGIKEFDFKYNSVLDSVGFNRSSLDKYLLMFASRGYAVMVVQQETTAETDLEKEQKKAKKATEARKVTEQFTPGTRRQLAQVENIADNICMFSPLPLTAFLTCLRCT